MALFNLIYYYNEAHLGFLSYVFVVYILIAS